MSATNNRWTLALRLLHGAAFTLFGLNGFLHFMAQPTPTPEGGALLGALAASGYMFPLIKGTEVVAGLMLLAGWRAPLALVLLMPVLVNIVLYHVILDPNGTPVGLLLLGINLLLAYAHRSAYAPLLAPSQREDAVTAPRRTAAEVHP